MEEEKASYHETVCFLTKEHKILLGFKMEKDCWNGYGGGIEDGESPIETAVRKLEEETNDVIALPKHLEKIAIVYFHNTKSDENTFVCKVHFYLVRQWRGEVQETDEMITPTWFDIDSLPFSQMMPADMHWLPIALSGKKIIATAKYKPFQKELLGDVEIECVKHFDDD